MEQMTAVVENLKKGLWRTEGTGGSGNSILIDALIRVTGQKRATVEAAVAAADEAKMKTWKGNAAVSAAMKQIVAERAAERAAESDEEVVL
jgi:DNA repair ATPase RecN